MGLLGDPPPYRHRLLIRWCDSQIVPRTRPPAGAQPVPQASTRPHPDSSPLSPVSDDGSSDVKSLRELGAW